MANIMNEVNFRNNTSRESFDLSQKIAFTAKTGELLPVWVQEVLPGDKYKVNMQALTRTMPLNSAAYVRIKEYYDFYFVPYRLLWRYAPDVFTQMPNSNTASALHNPVVEHKKMPYMYMYDVSNNIQNMGTAKNWFGNFTQCTTRKLLSYLGYGVTPTVADSDDDYYGYDIEVNPFPLLAYQKIYNDYFRDQQWEKSDPTTFNLDYVTSSDPFINANDYNEGLSNPSMFRLQYANWQKDMFMGLLPSPQYGDTAIISPLKGTFSANVNFTTSPEDGDNQAFITPNNDVYNQNSGLSVLALRQAEFLQKWKEIAQSGRQDYKSQIQKHFGVNVPEVLSNRCLYLGGHSTMIDIDGVTNNNLEGDNQPTIKGRGIGTNGGYIDFDAKEHGIIMCIYHNQPLLDYKDTRLSPLVTKTDATDFAIPEFDKVGMQPVYSEHFIYGQNEAYLDYSTQNVGKILGYAPRYVDYKTSTDVVRGEFLYTLKQWVAPIQNIVQDLIKNRENYSQWFTYHTFKINPTILDSIFVLSADDTKVKGDLTEQEYIQEHPLGTINDQFIINSFFDVKAVRNLDRNGLPY